MPDITRCITTHYCSLLIKSFASLMKSLWRITCYNKNEIWYRYGHILVTPTQIQTKTNLEIRPTRHGLEGGHNSGVPLHSKGAQALLVCVVVCECLCGYLAVRNVSNIFCIHNSICIWLYVATTEWTDRQSQILNLHERFLPEQFLRRAELYI